MSVIEAAAMRCRTMSDGSLRIEAEVSPADAQAAFKLFGMPGAPMALAALTQQAAQESAQKQTIGTPTTDPDYEHSEAALRAAKPKGGNLSKDAAMICQDEMFREFVGVVDDFPTMATVAHAAEFVRQKCEIESRAELDHNKEAAQRFATLMGDYRAWLKAEA